MKREIKFRFWNKIADIMQNDSSGWYENLGLNEMFQGLKSFDIIPMQYTGLKDKSEKEIYEDDIVKWEKRGGNIIKGVVKYEQQGCAYWVKWFDEEKRSRYVELQATSGGDFYQNDYMEIIGNIYENPELLSL